MLSSEKFINSFMNMKKKIIKSIYFIFLKEYRRNFREIGSIMPDSNACLNRLLKFVPFDSVKVILEYGSASGAVTREIIKRKRRETDLICFEKNNTFFNLLIRDIHGGNVFLINDDVLNSPQILSAEVGMSNKGVDCIISTLPCSSLNFDEFLQKAVIPFLKKDGLFIQYMHILSLLKGFRLNHIIRKYFYQINSGFVLLNIPPAFIYSCRIVNRRDETADNTT